MRGIVSVEYCENFKNSLSPACVNRRTGHMKINLSRWVNIIPQHRLFIMLHESGHVELDTSDEELVDAHAHEQFTSLGYPLTESVFALTRVLHADSEANRSRIWKQYQRCLEIDKQTNNLTEYHGYSDLLNNPTVFIKTIARKIDADGFECIDVEFDHYDEYESYDDFKEFNINDIDKIKTYSNKTFRKKKKAIRLYKKYGRGQLIQARVAKKYAKGNLVQAKANDTNATAEARDGYMRQGILYEQREAGIGKGIGGFAKTIAGAFGGMFGKGGGGGVEDVEQPEPVEVVQMSRLGNKTANRSNIVENKSTVVQKNNNKKIVLGVAAVAVVVVVALLIFKNK